MNDEVRIIKITDEQFGRIEVFYGKKREPTEKPLLNLIIKNINLYICVLSDYYSLGGLLHGF